MTEYLRFHAQLRMPAGSCAAAREARVQALLADFGLLRCAHSRIGDSMLRGLSGGEKRRLSIATELLTAPRLLLADEPTTGALRAGGHLCTHRLSDVCQQLLPKGTALVAPCR